MRVQAITKYARVSPSKTIDLARAIQGKSVPEALQITQFSPRKSASLLRKTLKSAIANAENNAELSAETMVVSEAAVMKGPIMRRYWCGARGMAKPIAKRTSHIKIVLSERQDLQQHVVAGKGKES